MIYNYIYAITFKYASDDPVANTYKTPPAASAKDVKLHIYSLQLKTEITRKHEL
jgi:hypothetical protein